MGNQIVRWMETVRDNSFTKDGIVVTSLSVTVFNGAYKGKITDDESDQMTSVRADDWDWINQAMMEEDDDPDNEDSDERDRWD